MDGRPNPYRLCMDRCKDPEQIHLVTTTTQNRIPWFRDFRKARHLVRCLMDSQYRGMSNTLAYVVMPDHLHWLFVPGENLNLSHVVGAVKTALEVFKAGRDRTVDAAGDFISQDNSGNKVFSADLQMFSQGQRGRHTHHAGVI